MASGAYTHTHTHTHMHTFTDESDFKKKNSHSVKAALKYIQMCALKVVECVEYALEKH